MGHMDVISFISDGFNIYFPMLIFLLCVATIGNIGGYILNFFGFEQFIGNNFLNRKINIYIIDMIKAMLNWHKN